MFKPLLTVTLSSSLFLQSAFAAGNGFHCVDLLQNSHEGVSAQIVTVKTLRKGQMELVKVLAEEGRTVQTNDVIDLKSEILFGWEASDKINRHFVILLDDLKVSIVSPTDVGLPTGNDSKGMILFVERSWTVNKGFYMSARFEPAVIEKAKKVAEGLQAGHIARAQTGAVYTDAQRSAEIEAFLSTISLRDRTSKQKVLYGNGQAVHPVLVGNLSEKEIKDELSSFSESLSESNLHLVTRAGHFFRVGVTLSLVVMAVSLLHACMKELEAGGNLF